MEKGTEFYQALINHLVKRSRVCVDDDCVKRGEVRDAKAETGTNSVLAKLSPEGREILAQYVPDSYFTSIYDTLQESEWPRVCRNMMMTAEGEILPAGKFEGMPCDYIGR